MPSGRRARGRARSRWCSDSPTRRPVVLSFGGGAGLLRARSAPIDGTGRWLDVTERHELAGPSFGPAMSTHADGWAKWLALGRGRALDWMA